MSADARDAETAVVSRLLADPRTIPDVAGTLLTGADFADFGLAMTYDKLVESFYADEACDPISVAAELGPKLARAWRSPPEEVAPRLRRLAASIPTGRPTDHALIVKRAADSRRLIDLAATINDAVQRGDVTPEAIAGEVSHRATQIATSAMSRSDIVSFADAGRAFVQEAKVLIAARKAGTPLGVYTGLGAVDVQTSGIKPTELLVAAGEPGVGKSAVWWRAGMNFADRQVKYPVERQIGTLILSLEMGQSPSNARVAQMLTGTAIEALRGGTLAPEELQKIVEAWAHRKGYPLWFNYASGVRASQLRALVSEAVRKHNVGFVILDHFRMFRMDSPPRNSVDHDEEKVIFLKEQIAKDLNVAVVCLAHTRKIDADDGRPRGADLRGSDQIRAHADFLNFLYRPIMYASEREIENGTVDAHKAELIWSKNRHGGGGTTELFFDPSRMSVM